MFEGGVYCKPDACSNLEPDEAVARSNDFGVGEGGKHSCARCLFPSFINVRVSRTL
jgi:hypothetical protein